MLKITRTTLLEGFHDSPFLWVPINWSNIALIWSEADILGPGCQSEIKASDITTCPKIPPNSGADDSKPIKTFLSHLSALKRNNFTFIKCEKCSGRCDLAVEAGQSRCYCWSSPLIDYCSFSWHEYSPPKKWFKRENTKDHNWGNLGAGRCCRGPSSVDSLQVGFATSTTLGRWRRHFFCFYKHRRCS